MLLPSISPRADVEMTQRTSVSNSQRFPRQTFFLFNVSLVYLLLDCFLAARTFFVVFAVLAFPHQMCSQGADLHSLSALSADGQHGTCVVVMHIFVVFFYESFVVPFAELAVFILVVQLSRLLFGNLYELITGFHLELRGSSAGILCLWLDWSLVIGCLIVASSILQLVLNGLYYWRS